LIFLTKREGKKGKKGGGGELVLNDFTNPDPSNLNQSYNRCIRVGQLERKKRKEDERGEVRPANVKKKK